MGLGEQRGAGPVTSTKIDFEIVAGALALVRLQPAGNTPARRSYNSRRQSRSHLVTRQH